MTKPSKETSDTLSLLETLDHLISTQGFVTVKTYMRLCLQHPTDGYYAAKNHIIGQRGDFITAPEISQLFGEIIAIWAVHQWQELGAPEKFHLVEAGPGHGTLMDDLLRTSAVDPNFLKAANIHCIEINPSLKQAQKTVLDKYDITPTYHEDISELRELDAPILFIANEFYDVLPIQHFKNEAKEWHEVVITKNKEDNFVPSLFKTEDAEILPKLYPWAFNGDKAEISTAVITQHKQLLSALENNGGAGLIIDYGPYKDDHGFTWQAIYNQETANPLENPGESDLTAHVNFDHLEHITNTPFMHIETQADFLKRYGIKVRLRRLFESPDIKRKEVLKNGYDRLIDDDQMGTLFKTLHCAYPVPK